MVILFLKYYAKCWKKMGRTCGLTDPNYMRVLLEGEVEKNEFEIQLPTTHNFHI